MGLVGARCRKCWPSGGAHPAGVEPLLAVEPAKGGPIPGAELQQGLRPRRNSHHIAGLVAVAPETKGMAEFVQGRGPDCRLGLPWADRHGDQRFDLPLA